MLLLPRHICGACRHLELEAHEAELEMGRAYTQFLQAFGVSVTAGWPLVTRMAGLGVWGNRPMRLLPCRPGTPRVRGIYLTTLPCHSSPSASSRFGKNHCLARQGATRTPKMRRMWRSFSTTASTVSTAVLQQPCLQCGLQKTLGNARVRPGSPAQQASGAV